MKKAIAIVLSAMLVFALCACGSSSSTTESSKADSSVAETKAEVTEAKADSAVGSWVMESFKQESGTEGLENYEFTMSIDINEDGTFSLKQETATIKGEATGTYKEENGKYSFHSTHTTLTVGDETEEDDDVDDFTGELNGDKLTLVNPEATPSTVYMKRA